MDIKFKIGDEVIGIKNDIIDSEGIIEKIRENGYSIRITKSGIYFKRGELCEKNTFWEDSLKLKKKEFTYITPEEYLKIKKEI